MPKPKAAILADDLLQQHLLRTALAGFGFEVVLNTAPSKLTQLPTLQVEVWVVNVHDEDENFQWLDELLNGQTPVLFGIDPAPQKNNQDYPRWEKKLYSKLRALKLATPFVPNTDTFAHPNKEPAVELTLPQEFHQQDFSGQVAQQVWLLGASLGGPAAVSSFLNSLPAGLPVAFIYAQHIDPRFETSLPKAIGRHSSYKVKNFIENEPLLYGEVLVAPINYEFEFNSRLLPQATGNAWLGPYGPSIDQVIGNINYSYQHCAGYIIFSGMGSDGSEALKKIDIPNLPIWAQQPDSCASASMPESAIATGKVDFIGTPEQLAAHLVEHLKQQWMTAHEPNPS